MKTYPIFTIATVTWNAGQTIGRTLHSVEEQTYHGVEHLIIDGCSDDDTMQEIQRYVERNADEPTEHTIRLVREPDNGLYDAMNKAIGLAKGDYIVFLNAGDKLHTPDTLQQVAECIRRYPQARRPVVVYGETDLVDDEGRFLRHRRLQAPERLTSRSFLQGMLVCHQSFYVRTDIAQQEPYDLHYRYSADYDWCIRLMRRGERRGLAMLNTGMVLTDYLSEGMTTRNHRASLMERLRLMGRHYGWPAAIGAHLWFVVRAVVRR